MNDERIPVSIITGFLGAGKTTLLNNLIQKRSDKRFAIIENEVGSINIDSRLVVAASENIVELSNGCICCSLHSDFTTVVENLATSSFEFDHLLVETTGIADPLSIVKKFIEGENIQFQFRVESVVCVVDAENMEDLMTEQIEIQQQLAFADCIIINKTDSVSKTYADKLMEMLKALYPLAQMYATSFGNIENIELTESYAYDALMLEKSVKKFVIAPKEQKTNLLRNASGLKHHIEAVGFEFDRVFDIEKFSCWIRNYLYFNKTTIYRAKGILAFDEMPEKYIFHSVRGSFLFETGSDWGNEKPQSKLVFIGKNINEPELKLHLEELLVALTQN